MRKEQLIFLPYYALKTWAFFVETGDNSIKIVQRFLLVSAWRHEVKPLNLLIECFQLADVRL